VSALSVSANELNLALRTLRRQFSRDLPSGQDGPEQSPEILSAILLTVSLKHLETQGLVSRATELHAQLLDFMPGAISHKLPCPSAESLKIAERSLNNAAYDPLWRSASSIGFAHQILGSASRAEALEKVQVANKMVATDTLIAFTQIYTPDWVTDFLLSNTLLPLIESDGGSRNGDSLRFRRWQLGEPSTSSNLKVLEQLRVIDPACGAGNFLLAAYDLLKVLYAERGVRKEVAVRQILEEQLFGADIDETGLAVGCLALLTKKLIDAPDQTIHLKNIVSARNLPGCEQIELLGSISRRWDEHPQHVLSGKYDVVVTNPPYVGRRLISRELKGLLLQEYPLTRSDLAAAFLEGSLKLLSDGGRLGAITQSSLLAIPSYRKFRNFMEQNFDMRISIECGAGVFPLLSGEKADSVLLVIEKPKGQPVGNGYVVEKLKSARTVDRSDELLNLVLKVKEKPESHQARGSRLPVSLTGLEQVSQLQSVASVKQGLATTNNARFVRLHWDVDQESGNTWVPYIKGAGSERWHSPILHVVKWADNGREIKQAVADAYPYLGGKTAWVVKNEQYYFKPGLCFSFINKRRLAVRRLPKGCIFDVASSAIFAHANQEGFLFGYLNSTLASALISQINPTINVQVGDVKKIPLPPVSSDQAKRVCDFADACFSAKQELAEFIDRPFCDPINPGGNWKEIWQSKDKQHARLAANLDQLEDDLDRAVMTWVIDALGIDESDSNELANWLNAFKESLLSRPLFFREEQLFAKLIYDLVGNKVSTQTDGLVLLPVTDDKGDLGRALSNLSDRRVFDFAKPFKGTSRYLGLRLPSSGGGLLFSRRAVSNYLRLTSAERNRFWSDVAADERTVNEVEDLLRSASKSLDGDWTTKDLIAALDCVLAAKKVGA
jgi:hypothetical protein